MLIKALCEYYDMLAEKGAVLPEGYSEIEINYLISLTKDGVIDDIIDYQEEIIDAKNKSKKVPKKEIFPLRSEKSAIESNVIEHRPIYIFGLNLEKDKLTTEDKSNKAQKSHEAFVKKQLEFLEGLNTPIVNAFRLFVENWDPQKEAETQNKFLLNLGNKYAVSKFAFCLNTDSTALLHEDKKVKEKWEKLYSQPNSEQVYAQCAVSGKNETVARLHNKIKGIAGGQTSGTSLVSYNNSSEESYGNTQSYNSNISQTAMKKYTEALNYLLSEKDVNGNRKYVKLFDDTTVIYWAMDKNEKYTDLFDAIFFGDEKENLRQLLDTLLSKVQQGNLNIEQALSAEKLNPKVDFYLVGIKPNSSRLALKFIYHQKFADLLKGALMHQKDLQIGKNYKPLAFWQIRKELLSPKSSNDQVNPTLMAKLFESMLTGSNYPQALLETMLRRCKIDKEIGSVRASTIKACINRANRKKGKKEELTMSLDKNNLNQAYLCGRLFAVLEKIQRSVYGDSLNRTIKDAYFSSAATTPAIIFPKLLKLAEYHLQKLDYSVNYRKQMQEIISGLSGEFPKNLSLTEQGKFMIGYYHQYESFFEKKNNTKDEAAQ